MPGEMESAARTRLETLVAWAQWELMSVPRERFRYLKKLLAGDNE